jgi:hypothetical protein
MDECGEWEGRSHARSGEFEAVIDLGTLKMQSANNTSHLIPFTKYSVARSRW